MQLPEALLGSLKNVEGFDRQTFEDVHAKAGRVVSVRINPAKTAHPMIGGAFSNIGDAIPWSQYGYYLSSRPSFTFDPLFHAGCYYVQEASSMFLEQALQQLAALSQPLKLLDLSAAPGGKSTHIQSLLTPGSLLVSNEVIRSRCAILTDNIIKWGSGNVVVTNNDPAAFQKLGGYFDVIVVDAPCSGSGLFRKDPEAIREWSLNNVMLCSQRQQRILADVLPALKQNGLLVYSTCSYSKEENEDISDWLVETFEMKNERLKMGEKWGIIESTSPETQSKGYRFYPDKVKGEGFFIACFRKTTHQEETKIKPVRLEKTTSKEKTILQAWLKKDEIDLVKENDAFSAIPSQLVHEYAVLRSVLNIQYKGVGIGQVMKEKLVPHHSLALSTLLSENVATTELSYEEAIKYLQRQDLNFRAATQGWQTVNYQKHPLGWINALSNRINNYYPKEMRILKRENDSSFQK